MLHLVGFALFLVAHGVSMSASFRIRREPDRAVVAALLGLSSRGSQLMYLGFLLLGIGGLGAAASVGWLTATWVVASYVVIVVVILLMYMVGAGFYTRSATGSRAPKRPRGSTTRSLSPASTTGGRRRSR